MNLVRGAQNLVEDWERAVAGKQPVGRGGVPASGETVAHHAAARWSTATA